MRMLKKMQNKIKTLYNNQHGRSFASWRKMSTGLLLNSYKKSDTPIFNHVKDKDFLTTVVVVKFEIMASRATRIGRNVFKLRKHFIREDLRRSSSMKKDNSQWSKKVIPVGCGIGALVSITGYVFYLQKRPTEEESPFDGKFTAFGKGKVDNLKIEVHPNGCTIDFTTDFNGKTHYRYTNEDFTSDKYQFIQHEGENPNPKVEYKEENTCVITYSVSEK